MKKIVEKIQRVEELGLSKRAENALLNFGIETIEDLLKKTKDEILRVDGFGRGSLDELVVTLRTHKLKLKPKEKKKDEDYSFKQALVTKFLKNDRPINWPQEMRLATDLLKKYPDKQFWERYNLGFKLNTLFYFYSADGKKKLANYYNAKLNAIKTEENVVQLEENKVGEDIVIVKKPLSVKDFLNGI